MCVPVLHPPFMLENGHGEACWANGVPLQTTGVYWPGKTLRICFWDTPETPTAAVGDRESQT